MSVVFVSIPNSYARNDHPFPQEKVDKICFENRRTKHIYHMRDRNLQRKPSHEIGEKVYTKGRRFLDFKSEVPALGSNQLGDLYIGPDPDTVFIDTDYVQDGDIIIFGEGILVVDDAKITLSGQLWCQDQGQAIFRNNAHLHFNQFYVGQYYVWLIDNATFEIVDGTVDANGVMHFVQLHDHCTYIAKRTAFPDWTFRKVFDHSTLILEDVEYVGDLLVDDSCFVHFTRCDTLMPWFEIPDGSVIQIQFPEPDYVDHFEFSNEMPGMKGVGYQFIADNCRECWWSLETFPGCSIDVNNSIIRGSCSRIPSNADTFSIEGIVNYEMHSDLVVPLHDRHVRYVNTYVYWWNWYPMDQTVFYMDSCVFGEMIGKESSEIYATRSTHSGHSILLGSIDSAFVSFADGFSQAFVGSWNRATMLLTNTTVTPLMPYQSTNLAHGCSYFLAVNSSFEYEPVALDTALVMFAAIDSPAVSVIGGGIIDVIGSVWIDAGPHNPITFDQYRLYWFPQGTTTWGLIADSKREVHHDILGTWKLLGEWDEGDYDLVLTLWDSAGDSLTAFKRVTLSHTLCTKGDVDDNEAINILDIILTVNIILEIHEPTDQEFCAADVDNNDKVDILDILHIVNHILAN